MYFRKTLHRNSQDEKDLRRSVAQSSRPRIPTLFEPKKIANASLQSQSASSYGTLGDSQHYFSRFLQQPAPAESSQKANKVIIPSTLIIKKVSYPSEAKELMDHPLFEQIGGKGYSPEEGIFWIYCDRVMLVWHYASRSERGSFTVFEGASIRSERLQFNESIYNVSYGRTFLWDYLSKCRMRVFAVAFIGQLNILAYDEQKKVHQNICVIEGKQSISNMLFDSETGNIYIAGDREKVQVLVNDINSTFNRTDQRYYGQNVFRIINSDSSFSSRFASIFNSFKETREVRTLVISKRQKKLYALVIKSSPSSLIARKYVWRYGSILNQVTVVEVYNTLNGSLCFQHEIVESVIVQKLRANWAGFQQNSASTLQFRTIYIDEDEGDKLAIALTCGAFIVVQNTQTQLISKVYYPQNIPQTSLVLCPRTKLKNRAIEQVSDTLGYRSMSIYNNRFACFLGSDSQDTCSLDRKDRIASTNCTLLQTQRKYTSLFEVRESIDHNLLSKTVLAQPRLWIYFADEGLIFLKQLTLSQKVLIYLHFFHELVSTLPARALNCLQRIWVLFIENYGAMNFSKSLLGIACDLGMRVKIPLSLYQATKSQIALNLDVQASLQTNQIQDVLIEIQNSKGIVDSAIDLLNLIEQKSFNIFSQQSSDYHTLNRFSRPSDAILEEENCDLVWRAVHSYFHECYCLIRDIKPSFHSENTILIGLVSQKLAQLAKLLSSNRLTLQTYNYLEQSTSTDAPNSINNKLSRNNYSQPQMAKLINLINICNTLLQVLPLFVRTIPSLVEAQAPEKQLFAPSIGGFFQDADVRDLFAETIASQVFQNNFQQYKELRRDIKTHLAQFITSEDLKFFQWKLIGSPKDDLMPLVPRLNYARLQLVKKKFIKDSELTVRFFKLLVKRIEYMENSKIELQHKLAPFLNIRNQPRSDNSTGFVEPVLPPSTSEASQPSIVQKRLSQCTHQIQQMHEDFMGTLKYLINSARMTKQSKWMKAVDGVVFEAVGQSGMKKLVKETLRVCREEEMLMHGRFLEELQTKSTSSSSSSSRQ